MKPPRPDRAAGPGPGAPPSPTRGILRLSFPLVVSFGLRSLYQIVDSLYAAQLDGVEDPSVAAIGFTVPFEFFMTACWVGASNGLTSQLAAAIGAGRHDRVEELKRASLRIVLTLVAVFLGVAVVVWNTAERLPLEPVMARQLKIYATVLLGGSALTAFWSILPDSLVKAHHDTKSTMWAGLISGGSNVALNTLFVFGFGMGILGIALSTVLGRLFALVYASWRAALHERHRRETAPRVPETAPGRPVRDVLYIAVPSGFTFALMSVESFAVNWIVAESPDSTAAIAAWSIFDRGTRFFSMPLIAVGVAMLPLVARLWGTGDLAGIRHQLRTAGAFGALYLLAVVTPVALLFGDSIAALFTEAPDARRLAGLGMRWLPLAVLAAAPFFPLRSAFEGMNDPRPGLVVSAVRALGLVVPLAWLGMPVASVLGHPPILGVFVGSTLGIGIASAWLARWMGSGLAAASR